MPLTLPVGVHMLLMMARTASVLWAITVLKHSGTCFLKISAYITYEHKMAIHNTLVYFLMELLLSDLIMRAVEKLSQVQHDEAIRKGVSFTRRASQSSKQ